MIATATDVDDGIHQGVPDPAYRAWPRMSKSTLEYANPGDLRPSMARLKAAWDGEFRRADTPAMALGRAFDTRLLQPELFAAEFAVMPDFGDCRKTENKAARNEWLDAHEGKQLIDGDDAQAIEAMRDAVFAHPVVKLIRQDGGAQASLAWTDAEFGVGMKGRLDKLAEHGKPVIVDVKSIVSNDDRTVQRQVSQFGYHRQDAVYVDGFHAITGTMPGFLFVFVAKSPPFDVRVVELEPGWVELGRKQYRNVLRHWVEAMANDHYPPAYQDIYTLETPKWVEIEIEQFGGM